MAKKINEIELISSIIGTIIVIYFASMLFNFLFQATNFNPVLEQITTVLVGFILPGAAEIFKVIIPYFKQPVS